MNKLHKILWSIISGAICILYRSECIANGCNCDNKTELLYSFNILVTPGDESWKDFCSNPSKHKYDTGPTYGATPTEPIPWGTTLMSHQTAAKLYSNRYFLYGCKKRGNVNTILINDGTPSFIDNCNPYSLIASLCPYNGIVASPIIVYRGIGAVNHFICTTACPTDDACSANLKLYRQSIDCTGCTDQTPNIADCYQPAKDTESNDKFLYKNAAGYFTLSKDCYAKEPSE